MVVCVHLCETFTFSYMTSFLYISAFTILFSVYCLFFSVCNRNLFLSVLVFVILLLLL